VWQIARAQDQWYQVYRDGESAFKKGDYNLAERKMLEAMSHPSAPKTRGPDVLQISQQRGFIPEYYLALIYNSQKKYAEAVKYATVAGSYLTPRNRPYYDNLRDTNDKAKLALNGFNLPLGGGSGTSTAVAVNAALEAGRFDDARTAARQGQTAGTSAAEVTDLLKRIDQQEFTVVMRDAAKARDARQYAEATRLAGRARELNVDNSKADALTTDISNRETFARLLADGRRALAAHQFAQARDNATRARALNLDNQQVDALVGDISRQENFESLLTKAQKSYDGRQFADARVSAQQARNLNVDNPKVDALIAEIGRHERFEAAIASARTALDANRFADARRAITQARAMNVDEAAATGLSRRVDVQDLTKQLESLVAAKSMAAMPAVIEKLDAIDPRNRTVFAARSLMAASASDDQKERLGVGQFYRGEYADAVAALSPLSDSGRMRAHLYLACSKAALALIERNPEKRQSLEREARQHLQPVRARPAAFASDLRYLSPSIVQMLGLAGS
jgi:hypothetical protein